MAKYPRRAVNASMTLTTRTVSGTNSVGSVTYTETTATDDVVLQFIDGLEDPSAGNVRFQGLIAVTDPVNLTPTVSDEATVDGVDYRILEVRAVYWKGIKNQNSSAAVRSGKRRRFCTLLSV